MSPPPSPTEGGGTWSPHRLLAALHHRQRHVGQEGEDGDLGHAPLYLGDVVTLSILGTPFCPLPCFAGGGTLNPVPCLPCPAGLGSWHRGGQGGFWGRRAAGR